VNYDKGNFVTLGLKKLFFAYILGHQKGIFLLILRDGGSNKFYQKLI
jgi:hypothetical protein